MEIRWNREQAKKYFDKSRVEAPHLKRGDRVYLKRRTKGSTKDNIFTKKESTKLDVIMLGPFTIKKVLQFDNYELWLPPKMRIHPVFHISLLKPTENEPTKEDVELEEFEVEKIIGKRVQKGQEQFKIRWKGFEEKDDTWEPRKNLNCPEKVQEFEEQERSSEDSRVGEPTLKRLVSQKNEDTGTLTNHLSNSTEIAREDHQNRSVKSVHALDEVLADERTRDGRRQKIDRQPSLKPSFVVRSVRSWKQKYPVIAQSKRLHSLGVEGLGEKQHDQCLRYGYSPCDAAHSLSIGTSSTRYNISVRY